MRDLLKTVLLLISIMTGAFRTCQAQDVVLVHSHKNPDLTGTELTNLIKFLGLNVVELEPSALDPYLRTRKAYGDRGRHLVAIALFADDLPTLKPQSRQQMITKGEPPIPALIYGVSERTDVSALKAWSGGLLEGCGNLHPGDNQIEVQFGVDTQIDRELSALRIPAVKKPACQLLGSPLIDREIMQAVWPNGQTASLLSKVSTAAGETFLVPEQFPIRNDSLAPAERLTRIFSSTAPYFLFLKYAAKNYAWHLDGRYANLTVDDPWLVEPYGNLHYGALLNEMKHHGFHTSIAFVPWNFERNTQQVVELFKQNQEYFSLCIHGNNHEHREFGLYPEVPLERQQQDIRQSVMRMEAMQNRTGLQYDRFMVFPHGVAPEETFRALHQNGFMGTANSENVPLDQPAPEEPLFWMKTYSLAYGDIVSLSRYSVEAPLSPAVIAIQLYLGNPILFYGHQQMFRNGSEAFDAIADAVNRQEKSTQWVSLGTLSRHLYELRQSGPGESDVRMLSSQISFVPHSKEMSIYTFTYEKAPQDRVAGVSVDGTAVAWKQASRTIVFTLRASDNDAHDVRVILQGPVIASGVSTESQNLNVGVLRRLSDFRDMYLSRYSWGRNLVDLYYDHGGDSFERIVERRWFVTSMLLILSTGCCFRFRRHYKRRRVRTVRRELAR